MIGFWFFKTNLLKLESFKVGTFEEFDFPWSLGKAIP